jgi:NifU-like protein involved in Fe-S cluster formation
MSATAQYPAEVWRRFRTPTHAGAPVAGARVGRGGERRQGGEIELWFTVAAGRIDRAGFRAFGCPYAVATADLACQRLLGQDPAVLLEFDASALMEGLQVPPERFPVKIWIEDAVRAAAR